MRRTNKLAVILVAAWALMQCAAPAWSEQSRPAAQKQTNFVGTWSMWGQGAFGVIDYGPLLVRQNKTYHFRGKNGAYRLESGKLKFTSGPLAPNTVEVVGGDCCEMVWQGKNYQNWMVTRPKK